MKECYQEPTQILNWPKDCDFVMFIDENNINNSTNNIKNKIINNQQISVDEQFFTITGCIFSNSDYETAKKIISNVKLKHFSSAKICFHSYEIRNRHGAFKLDDNKYNQFIVDLDKAIDNSNYVIISISINIVDYIIHTSYNMDLYNIAFNFILERYIYFMKGNKKGLLY